MTVAGTGTVGLGGANSLAGAATLTSGTLALSNNATTGTFGAFGGTTNLFNITGGTLQSASPAGVTIAQATTLNMGTALVLNNNSGTTTDTYPDSSNLAWLPLGQESFTVSGSDPLTFTGVVSGPGGITVDTTSTLTFNDSAANTYQGNTTVNLGTVALNSIVTSTTIGADASSAGNWAINSENLAESLTFSSSSASGTFELQLGSATTAPITYSSVPATLQSAIATALGNLGSVGSANVSVSANSATSVTVTFINALAGSPTLVGESLIVLSNTLAPATTITPTVLQAGGPGIVDQIGDPNELTYVQTNPNTLTFSANVTISGSGSLVLGATSILLGSLTFLNGGSVTMNAVAGGTLTLVNNIQTESTNGIPTSATITGGNLVLSSSGVTGGNAPANVGRTITVAASSTSGVTKPFQQLKFNNGTTAGNFTLSFAGDAVATPISFSTASGTLASNIQSALNGLASIDAAGSVSVAVTGDTNAVQTLTFAGGPTGGTFTLAFNGVSTSPAINYSTSSTALASNIQAALNALSSIGLATFGSTIDQPNVSVSVSGSVATITFLETLGVQSVSGLVPGPVNGSGVITTLQATGTPTIADLTTIPGTAPVATVTFPNATPGVIEPNMVLNGVPANAVQVVSLPGNLTSGTFILSYDGATTAPITYSSLTGTLATNVNNAAQ